MFSLFGKKKLGFERKILRKNDISLLILDERWNKLFADIPKTPGISSSEEKLKELVKAEARLTAENKKVAVVKKQCMDRIIKLTPEVFDKSDEAAMNEMAACEEEIKRSNARLKKISEELEDMPERIKEANLELLENTVRDVYLKIGSRKKRMEELDKLIEEARTKLKGYIDERGTISQGDTDMYAYFHDLLGGEELERLDKEFSKGR